jgi:hypothetical protein
MVGGGASKKPPRGASGSGPGGASGSGDVILGVHHPDEIILRARIKELESENESSPRSRERLKHVRKRVRVRTPPAPLVPGGRKGSTEALIAAAPEIASYLLDEGLDDYADVVSGLASRLDRVEHLYQRNEDGFESSVSRYRDRERQHVDAIKEIEAEVAKLKDELERLKQLAREGLSTGKKYGELPEKG